MDNTYKCEFGIKLSDFVRNCVLGLDDNEDISTFSEMLLQVLVQNKLAFDAARFYVAYGLLEGLEKKHLLVLGPSHINLLYSLFEGKAEGHILDTAISTINLKLLLHIDTEKVGLLSYFESLSYFVQQKDYKVYYENEEFFLEYLNMNFGLQEVIQFFQANSKRFDQEQFIVVLSNLIQNKVSISSLVPFVLGYSRPEQLLINIVNCELAFSDLLLEPLIVSGIERIITAMAQGSKDLPKCVYSDSAKLVANEDLFNDDFWMSFDITDLFESVVDDLNTSKDEVKLSYAISQFQFIANCVPKLIFNETFSLTIDQLAQTLQTAFASQPRGGDKTFYKSKDLFYGLVLSIIAQLLKINVVDSKIKFQILEISESVLTKSEYHCHLQNVNLLSQLIEINGSKFDSDDVSALIGILEEMWDMLIVDRLILSQKDLHQAFIRLLLNKTLLKISITNESINERIFKIADDIVSKSYGRKALLPVLFKRVSEYQLQDNSDFEKSTWLAKLLVRGAFLLQNIMNVFKLDIIIAGIYDKDLNLSGIPLYKQAYGDPEVSYKIYINVITASVKYW
ncbi:unnamed protein product [Ambrosiozyma monospora]|uniref:Unnamed protein product n=1 Tax=Ambrosiozyma monospora TaxID=43982 RepID=A0A9W7DJ20_AMBMO|nr:unnamed protein product [Ambrosiozyma monospora]